MNQKYNSLKSVLDRAYDQAATGKGNDRHGNMLDFEQQPMQDVTNLVGLGFPLGQAIKKAQEAQRMEKDKAVHELLGAINYLAGAIIWVEGKGD